MMSLLGGAIVTAVLVRVPATYFSESRRRFAVNAHPVLRWAGLFCKNVIGIVVVAVGLILAIPGIPGPGILIILLGIMLMDFPGKRRLELWVIRHQTVLGALNRLRRQHGKLPFVVEDSS
jgi:hypothetical protein